MDRNHLPAVGRRALRVPGNMESHMEQMAMGAIALALRIRICHLSLVEVLLAILLQFFFYSIYHLR
jgi:hypothetical protein